MVRGLPRRLHTSGSAHTLGAVLPVYRQNDLFVVWHHFCLGDLCIATSDAPDDQRCSIKGSRRAVRASNSPPISWPRLAGAKFPAFAVATVVQDQMSCALSPVVQSLQPSPVLPFVLEPLRVTKISRALLDHCALHSNLSLFVFISSHRHQIIDLVFCLLVLRCPLTVQTWL